MTLLDRLKSAMGFKAAVSAPIHAQELPRAYMLFLGARGELRPRECWELYKSVSTLAKAVDHIADAVSQLKPVAKVGDEIYDQHPVMELLNAPGFNRDRRRLIKELTVQYLVTGTCYPNLIGNLKAPPIAIDVLRAQHITITEGSDGWPGVYHLNEAFRTAVFTRDPNTPRDPRWVDNRFSQLLPIFDMEGDQRGVGLSRLQAVQEDVNLRLTGLQHNRSMLANGASLSGIASVKGNPTPDQKADLQTQMQRTITGANNSGKVLVTAGDGIDFKAMQQSNKDMDFATLINTVDQAIIARYNVPVTLFETSAQTHNNYAEAWRALYENAALPTFNVIYGGLARALSERYGEEITIEHDRLTNSVLADAAMERATKLVSDRLITPNEGREMIGYEPLAGGDNIYDLPGMIPQYEDLWTEDGPIERPDPGTETPKLEAPAGKAAGGGDQPLLKVIPGGA